MSTPVTTHERPPATGEPTRLTGASPVAAAALAAGIAYAWLEALWRLLFTCYPDFDAKWVLWDGRAGDIGAMWLTISVLAAAVGGGLYLLWRGKARIGAIVDWTVVLIGSAIAAPMIGEIGTPVGSISTGAGSANGAAIIAYGLLVVTIVVCVAVLTRLHRRR